jgi:hypothetical protein
VADWFEAERPLHLALYATLDRMRRRAMKRWWLVLLIAVVATAAVVRKVARKPQLHRARVILAITEGDLNTGWNPTPLDQLRDYIGSVLLSSERLLAYFDEHKMLERERAKLGDAAAVEEFRDGLGIGVWRNYFQYAWSYDERRSARVAIAYTDADPGYAYDMARAMAQLVIEGEAARRTEAAIELARQAREVIDAARARMDQRAREQSAVLAELAAAEAANDTARIGVLRARASTLGVEWQEATEAWKAVEGSADFDTLQAHVNAAGLALEMEIVDERRPRVEPAGAIPTLVIVGFVAFLIFFPVAGLMVGAFDTKVHDAEDLRRLAVPLLGHVPDFPGDRVGALRDRGVSGRRVPSYRRWQ